MGKTVLLADAAGRARSAGMRVLPVTGRESESRLAFAGLHQLLRPALSAAAGSARPAGPGSGRGTRPGRGPWRPGPAADRGGRLDPAVGPFRTVPGPGGRRRRPLAGPQLAGRPGLRRAAGWTPSGWCCWSVSAGRPRLPALTVASPSCDPSSRCPRCDACLAGRVASPAPRAGAGAGTFAQAAGNPMALIELATVIADDPAASRRWAAEPLPLTDRLTAVLTSRVRYLVRAGAGRAPLAAVADGPDLSAAATAVSGQARRPGAGR